MVDLLKEPGELLRKELIGALVQTGQRNKGNLEKSLKVEIIEGPIMTARITMNDYGLILETGVEPSKVPFGGKRGKFSLYLQGLMDAYNWDLGTAIKVAKTAKLYGHPTPGSFALSKNGKRTSFISDVLTSTKTLDDIAKIIIEKLDKQVL